jgi:predicted enzyme related to lactoylglutathione lyase
MAGNFFWYDVMSTDLDAARKFYGDVVGVGRAGRGHAGL